MNKELFNKVQAFMQEQREKPKDRTLAPVTPAPVTKVVVVDFDGMTIVGETNMPTNPTQVPATGITIFDVNGVPASFTVMAMSWVDLGPNDCKYVAICNRIA